jgi:hypothetical protein
MPFETVAMDLITDLPVSEGFDAIFTIMDHDATKAMVFIPCHKTIDALNTTQLYTKHVFPYYGVPKKIISEIPISPHSWPKSYVASLTLNRTLVPPIIHRQMDSQNNRISGWNSMCGSTPTTNR